MAVQTKPGHPDAPAIVPAVAGDVADGARLVDGNYESRLIEIAPLPIYGTLAELTAADPTLGARQIAYATDAADLRIGPGLWSTRPAFRRTVMKTGAEWAADTAVYPAGVIGYDTTSRTGKVFDGSTTWAGGFSFAGGTIFATRADFLSGSAFTGATLTDGEIGFETDTGKRKRGDGTTAYAALPYLRDATEVLADTYANFVATPPALAAGQIAVASDTMDVRFGPGLWSELTPLRNGGVTALADVPGLEDALAAKQDAGAQVPLEIPTEAGILTGADQATTFNSAIFASAKAVKDMGEVSGSVIVDCAHGTNLFHTAIGDFSVDGLVGLKSDQDAIVRFNAAATDAPHAVAYGAGVTVPAGAPTSLAAGETLVLKMSAYVIGTTARCEVQSFSVQPAQALVAPKVVDVTVTPDVGVDGGLFAVSYRGTGNEIPDAAFQWKRNGTAIPDATAAIYDSPSGKDGQISCAVTLVNATGSATGEGFSRIGKPIPSIVGGLLISQPLSSGVLLADFPLPAGSTEGHTAILIGAQQSATDVAWPEDFVQVGDQLARLANVTGSAYRTGIAKKALTEEDITAGLIAGVAVNSNSSVGLMVVRDGDGIDWSVVAGQFSRSAALAASSVALPARVSTQPSLAVVVGIAGDYPAKMKIGQIAAADDPATILSEWTPGPTSNEHPTGAGKYGLRWFTRPIGTGDALTGQIVTGGTANATLTAVAFFLSTAEDAE